MASLFIIDQSLKQTGGHHFDYTCLLANAANFLGFNPIVGTNRSLSSDAEDELLQVAQVDKVFRESTYTRLSHLEGLRELVKPKPSTELKPDPQKGRLHNLRGTRARNKRVKKRSLLITRFAEDCESFFDRYSLSESDHVLFTTISELEFMGLAAFLGSHPRTLNPTWHTQFHFSMFSGRPDEFKAQGRTERLLTNAFQSALARAPYHNLKTYTTSSELTDQYNRMELMSFQPLPYPVNPQLSIGARFAKPGRHTGPVKFAIAGGTRREKGQKSSVNQLIQSIWDSHLATGKANIQIQTGSPGNFACGKVMAGRRVSHKQFRDTVQLHSHPLPEADYVEFIRNSDAGLFCYDSRRYYSRRAGILSEFLAAGKPVIVPAGCWLSQQLAQANQQHIQSVLTTTKEQQTVDLVDFGWNDTNAPLAGGVISFDQHRNPYHCVLPRRNMTVPNPQAAVIRFRWQWPRETGSFVEVELTSFDRTNKQTDVSRQVVTCPRDGTESLIFLKIPEEFEQGTLRFKNAYANSSISLADATVTFLDFAEQPIPASSAVGIAAVDLEMVPAAVDEMVNHYDHYLKSAIEFSRLWSTEHDPLRTIEKMTAPDLGANRRVA